MNALILLLIVPLLSGGILFTLRRWPWATAVAGFLTALFLSRTVLLALGSISIMGRVLSLTPEIQHHLLLLYGSFAGLCLLLFFWPHHKAFVAPILLSFAPLAAALMIQPLSMSALFWLLTAVCFTIALQGQHPHRTIGAWRYLVVTLLATPFLLTAAWLLGHEQASLLLLASRLLAVACIMLLAGFPFHIWVMPAAEKEARLGTLFVLSWGQLAVTFFLLRWLQDYPALQTQEPFVQLLRISGTAVTLLAGLMVALGDPNGRPSSPQTLWGYLLLLDMGLGLFALTLPQELALHLAWIRCTSALCAFMGLQMWPPTAVSWRSAPFAAALFLYGCASLLGLPFTPGFNGRWAVFGLILPHTADSPWLVMGLSLALAAGVYAFVRFVYRLVTTPPDPQTVIHEPMWHQGLALLLLVPLIVLAFVPSFWFPG